MFFLLLVASLTSWNIRKYRLHPDRFYRVHIDKRTKDQIGGSHVITTVFLRNLFGVYSLQTEQVPKEHRTSTEEVPNNLRIE